MQVRRPSVLERKEMTVERTASALPKPKHTRAGWADAAKRSAAENGEIVAWLDFSDEDDAGYFPADDCW